MGKIIATDLDGTLFYPKDRKGMIYGNNLYLLQSFIDGGGRVVLVSGRSIFYARKVIEKIGRDCAVVAYNGAYVYTDEKVIYERKMENQALVDLVKDTITAHRVPAIFLMGADGMFVKLRNDNFFVRFFYKLYYRHIGIYAEDMDLKTSSFDTELNKGHIFKLMFFFGLGKKNKRRAMEINKFIRNNYEMFESARSDNVIEVTAYGCSKGNGLIQYFKSTDADKDDIYVVGDSGNDISMFKEFYQHSFCMSHAAESVKKYAKFTIDKFEDLSRYIY
jgi:Cof subfamily protein (haloacid dehalogenase superfamily)